MSRSLPIATLAAALVFAGVVYAHDGHMQHMSAPAASATDQSFDAQMARAMERMDRDMSVPPSGDYDRDFAAMMIPHHQQAVELAAMVPDRSTNPDVLALATKIAGAQQPEINTMKALLLQWDVDPNEMSHESGHAGMAMAGMVDDATMVKLDNLKGTDFDTLWLQSMISHHEGAIAMAKTEIADGKSADMVTLAGSIVTAQQAEIDQMKQMLIGLGV